MPALILTGTLEPNSFPEEVTMSSELFDKGLKIRTEVLGEAYVKKALASMDDFNKPLQELVTEYCWGAVWGREGLRRSERSMLNLAMISILNRPHELKAHIRGALTNGLTREQICEIFLQVAVYAGVPAAVDSFRIARETFAEIDAA
jgi:4-carboxymuconolactone decarboxylase